jgi:hypothetical protein
VSSRLMTIVISASLPIPGLPSDRPFKLTSRASLRCLCGCSPPAAVHPCKRHMSDERKWKYDPATLTIAEARSGQVLEASGLGSHVTVRRTRRRSVSQVVKHLGSILVVSIEVLWELVLYV